MAARRKGGPAQAQACRSTWWALLSAPLAVRIRATCHLQIFIRLTGNSLWALTGAFWGGGGLPLEIYTLCPMRMPMSIRTRKGKGKCRNYGLKNVP